MRFPSLSAAIPRLRHGVTLAAWMLVAGGAWLATDAGHAAGQLALSIRDAQDAPVACRVHLIGEGGEPVRPEGLPFWHDHFVCDGDVQLDLTAGRYELTVERGPEFESVRRSVKVTDGQTERLEVLLHRIVDLRSEGWYSADLHVHRPLEEIELLMRAEDLDYAPVITWWNGQNAWADRDPPDHLVRTFDGGRMYSVMAGEDERQGGALLYFGLRRPLDIAGASPEIPSPLAFVEAARRANPQVWIDIEKPFWWDVPTWLASGQVQSMGVAHNHMWRSGMLPNEAWGRARDTTRLPNPLGVAHWTQEIYYHALNAGLRLVPSAGSASGVLPNPVGYNRVYVHVAGPFTHDRWWQSLAQGQCFVTNGPLLVCKADGNLPGHVLSRSEGGPKTVHLDIELISRDRVEQLEVVRNGQVAQTIPCKPAVSQRCSADVTVDTSGWFLVRAIAANDQTFRFASTGPFYVELGQQPESISRRSCEFFLEWVEQRMERLKKELQSASTADAQQVLKYHQQAREFWRQRLNRANAP